MPHKPIAIVVAMSREVEPLVRGASRHKANGLEYFDLEPAVVVAGGIGRKAATGAAEAVVGSYSPEVLISAGLAGALTGNGKVGDVIRPMTVIDADSGERFRGHGEIGTLVTAAAVSGENAKRALAAAWQADVVDMEASAVAQVARNHGIEFAAVKSVSDELDFNMPPVGEYVDEDGKFNVLRFTAFLAANPGWWGAVRQLNTNSRIAAMKLSGVLQHLIQQQSQKLQ